MQNPSTHSSGRKSEPRAGIDAVSGQHWYEIRAMAAERRAQIFLYDIIGNWGITAQQFLRDCQEAGVYQASAIDLHIHSPGGDILQGLAIYNTLAGLHADITIYIDGMAASMASMIACLPGAKVHIPENAWMMVHKPMGGVAGDSDAMRTYAEWMDRNEAMMRGAYHNKTGLPEDELDAMMKQETWMTGAEAVEKGFADYLEPEMQAVACVNQNTLKDYHNMPETLNALFAPQAVSPTPAETPPLVPPVSPPVSPVVTAQGAELAAPTANTPQDIEALAAHVQQHIATASAARVAEITAVFEHFPAWETLKNTCLADSSCSAAQARERLLTGLGENTQPLAGNAASHLYAGNGNLVGDSVRASVMARVGYAPPESDNRYTGYTLRELARASLVDRGIGISGHASPMAMVGLAFTHSSSDFGNILMDVAHKATLTGWEEAGESFAKWTRKGTLTDFKTARRVGLGVFPTLREVRPGAEYKYVTLSDRGEPIALATYGELFSIDRQTVINDDLSMLTRIPSAMGMAAHATVGDLVWAVLTSNPAMSDGHALFSQEHNNQVKAGLTIEGLDLARQTMLLQKAGKRRLNIRPAFMLTPVAMESRATQLVRSASVPGADVNSGIINPVRDFVEIISEARLDDSSNTTFYLTAAQGRDTLEVAYLDGVDTPYLEQQQGFTVDGAAFKVRIDAGVAPLDWRGLVKVTGAAK